MHCKKFPGKLIFFSFLLLTSLTDVDPARAQGIRTVVLDAGHGGHDPGNLGTRRYKKSEKDISLDVVLKLGGYINQEFPDVKVIYTRKDDRFIPLHERAGIANRSKADLFISIHCNYAESPEASGTETWVMGLHRSKENLQVAMRENSVIYQEDNYKTTYADFDPRDPDSYIAMSLIQGAYLDQSVNLAAKVQEEFVKKTGRRSRGVKQAGLLVLYKSAMPAILVELGFLTNKEEEDFLHSDDGKTYMAASILAAFRSYKHTIESLTMPEEPKQENKGRNKHEYKPQEDVVKDEAQDNDSLPAAKGINEDPKPLAIQFKVQLLSSEQKISLDSPRLMGEKEVTEIRSKGAYKYCKGDYASYAEARKGLETMKKRFPTAFIVAFNNGNPIPVQEAIKLTQK